MNELWTTWHVSSFSLRRRNFNIQLGKNWTGLRSSCTLQHLNYIVILIYMHSLMTPTACKGTQAQTSLCDHEIVLKYIFIGWQSLRQKMQQFLIVSYSHCSCWLTSNWPFTLIMRAVSTLPQYYPKKTRELCISIGLFALSPASH